MIGGCVTNYLPNCFKCCVAGGTSVSIVARKSVNVLYTEQQNLLEFAN